MNFTRFTSLKIALLTGAMMCAASPSYAGFEFTAPPKPVAAVPAAPTTDVNAPMQLVPVTIPPVAQMPLDEAMMDAVIEGPDRDAVLPAKVVSQPQHVLKLPQEVTLEPETPVYVRRENIPSPVQAPKAQPMDAEILLRATEPAIANQALVINPYPLKDEADHSGNMASLPVEQAMMEEAGSLRPVAIPGHANKSGMMARADISARHDRGDQYKNITSKKQQEGAFSISSMTPIPGGEGAPLKKVSQQIEEQALPPIAQKPIPQPIPQAQMPRPAPLIEAAPAPEATAAQGAYSEAVGFGRDLPLALALSQVVPADYNYAFSQDVNVGTTVSWKGGKPWNQVLDEMLAPNGMRAVIENNTITIRNANS